MIVTTCEGDATTALNYKSAPHKPDGKSPVSFKSSTKRRISLQNDCINSKEIVKYKRDRAKVQSITEEASFGSGDAETQDFEADNKVKSDNCKRLVPMDASGMMFGHTTRLLPRQANCCSEDVLTIPTNPPRPRRGCTTQFSPRQPLRHAGLAESRCTKDILPVSD